MLQSKYLWAGTAACACTIVTIAPVQKQMPIAALARKVRNIVAKQKKKRTGRKTEERKLFLQARES